jgi:hypothetical protein
MKALLPLFMLVSAACGATAQSNVNIRLRSVSWDQNRDGTKDSYTEVIKRGTNWISSYMRLPGRTEVGFWVDQNHSFSMTDTNNDGRFDVFHFMSNMIPETILIRAQGDALEPVDADTLRKQQEFAATMTSEFPKMVSAAQSTNDNRDGRFWGAFSNIVEKALRTKSEPAGGADFDPASGSESAHP